MDDMIDGSLQAINNKEIQVFVGRTRPAVSPVSSIYSMIV